MNYKIEQIKELINSNPKGWTAKLKKDKDLLKVFLDATDPVVENIVDPNFALRANILLNNIKEAPVCPVCGNVITGFIQKKRKGKFSTIFSTFCSDSCFKSPEGKRLTKEKRHNTMLEKYGVTNPANSCKFKEKRRKTLESRYGVNHTFQSEEVKEKIKETIVRRYGVEHAFQSEKVKDKIKDTCLEKYGVRHPKFRTSVRKTNLEKLKTHMKEKNLQPLFSDEEYIYSKINDKLRYKCLTCKNEYFVVNNPKEDRGLYYQNFICSCSRNRSSKEIELAEFLESFNTEFKRNDKPVSGRLELDLFIPEHNLGIEYHGLYWHCENKKDPSYHQNKYFFFKENNIDVIQIFGNEWKNKRYIVESIIKRKLGKSDYILSSEETEIKIPSYQDYLQFLEENSIYSIPSTTPTQITGLYYNDTLVQLLALNNSDVLAYTTKLDYLITNGLHKLLSNLKQDLTVTINLRYSTGQEFIDYGFTPTTITEPNCLYTDYRDVHQTEFPDSYKIYDCGSLILNYKV